MFPWRKRNDGFEWREYVRTTILLRRKDRRQRIDEAKQSAVDAAKAAGRNSAQAAYRGGRRFSGLTLAAASWLLALPVRVARNVQPVVLPIVVGVFGALSGGTRALCDRLDPLFTFLRRREIRLPLIAIGLISAIGVAQRLYWYGFDQEVTIAGFMAAIAAILTIVPAYAQGQPLLPHRLAEAMARVQHRMPRVLRLDGLGRRHVAGAFAVALAIISGAGLWHGWVPVAAPTDQQASASQVAPPPDAIAGRAIALSGDELRIGGVHIHLAGIEAPEREQTCSKPGSSRWRCGQAAKNVLAKLVRGRTLRCILTGSLDSSPVDAKCRVRGRDVATELVEKGHVFAVSGLFAPYTGIEAAARAAKAGVWAGAAERPEDFRAKRWDEAKKASPDGCPIKGQVAGRKRIYHLPWSPAYDRVKVRTTRGERWFCSEDEAQAAGWRETTRS